MKLHISALLAVLFSGVVMLAATPETSAVFLSGAVAGLLVAVVLMFLSRRKGLSVPEKGAIVGFKDGDRGATIVDIYGGVLVMKDLGTVIDTAVAVEETQLSPSAVTVMHSLHRFLVDHSDDIRRGDLSFLDKLEQ